MSSCCSFKLHEKRPFLNSDSSFLLLLPPKMKFFREKKGAKDRSHTWSLFQAGISRLTVLWSHLVSREMAGVFKHHWIRSHELLLAVTRLTVWLFA